MENLWWKQICDSFHWSGSFWLVESRIHFVCSNDLSTMVLGTDFAIWLNSKSKLKWAKLPSHQWSSSGGKKTLRPVWYPFSRGIGVKTEHMRSHRTHQTPAYLLGELGWDEGIWNLVFLAFSKLSNSQSQDSRIPNSIREWTTGSWFSNWRFINSSSTTHQ